MTCWRHGSNIDLPKEYQRYGKDAGKDAKKRLVKATERRVTKGLDSEDFLRLEQLVTVGRSALYQADRLSTLQSFNFGAYVGKPVKSVVLILGLTFQLVALTALAVIGVAVFGAPDDFGDALGTVLTWWPFVVSLSALGLISVRRILLHLKDQEL